MKIGMIAGAAALATLVATPAMAQTTQQRFAGPQHLATDPSGAKKVTHRSRLESRAYYDERRSGFWPGDFAAGVVGGTISTAGTIATAPFTPFHGDSYAYYRDPGRAYYRAHRSGFWPGDFAAGVVGGAIGTAGAIATAPFTPVRGDSYAFYPDTSSMPNRGFIADQNGPTCVPGTMTTINGRRMLCQ